MNCYFEELGIHPKDVEVVVDGDNITFTLLGETFDDVNGLGNQLINSASTIEQEFEQIYPEVDISSISAYETSVIIDITADIDDASRDRDNAVTTLRNNFEEDGYTVVQSEGMSFIF